MYIYMGKRKPKLCRMKCLDVYQYAHFSFYWRWNNMFPPLLISLFLLAEKTIGDTKSHFELTLAISKENSPKCKIYAYRRVFSKFQENNSKILYTNLFESHESTVLIVHRWEYPAAHMAWSEYFTDGLHLLISQRDVEGFQWVSEMIGMGGAKSANYTWVHLGYTLSTPWLHLA